MAGCWSALAAKEKAPRVILVDKGKVSRSGKSSFSGAGILCPQHGDDFDQWHREMVERGKYFNDQDWIKVLLEEQPQRISEMVSWGVPFERDEQGNIARAPSLGAMIIRSATTLSLDMMACMRKRMVEMGVQLLERVMVTGLLTSDGHYPTKESVTGAFGFNTRTGEAYIINAKAVIMATGGFGYIDLSGDGTAMAFRAGVQVYNMEFLTTFDEMGFAGKYCGVHMFTFQRLGMRLVNSKGERFLEKYYPQQKERANRHEIAVATIVENLKGNGPVYMDMTHLNSQDAEKLRTLPGTAMQVEALKNKGIDFSKQRVKFDVFSGFLNFTNTGGIKHNLFGETSLAGLFAAGETGGYPPRGCASFGPLAICCVTGHRAGLNAARYASEQELKTAKEEQVNHLLTEAFSPLKKKTGLRPRELTDQIQNFLSPALISIFRNQDNIKKTLKEIERWKDKCRSLVAGDLHELVKASKVKNYISCAALVFRASLEREESRGVFLRTDHPYRDDINWLKHVVMQNNAEKGLTVSYTPLPLYRYPVRPDKYTRRPPEFPFVDFIK